MMHPSDFYRLLTGNLTQINKFQYSRFIKIQKLYHLKMCVLILHAVRRYIEASGQGEENISLSGSFPTILQFLKWNSHLCVDFLHFTHWDVATSYLDGDLVNLVEHIDAGDVDSVALDHIDQLFSRGVVPQSDVCVVDPVLSKDSLCRIHVQLWLGHLETVPPSDWTIWKQCRLLNGRFGSSPTSSLDDLETVLQSYWTI